MAKRSPILGYNHNVRYRGLVFHVQTEDSGLLNPHLFTHLFHGGVIVSTRKLVYDSGSNEEAIKALMQAQHKAVMKDLRRGAFDDKIDQYLGNTPGLEPRLTPAEAATRKAVRADRAATEISPPPDVSAPLEIIETDGKSEPIELPVKARTGTGDRTIPLASISAIPEETPQRDSSPIIEISVDDDEEDELASRLRGAPRDTAVETAVVPQAAQSRPASHGAAALPGKQRSLTPPPIVTTRAAGKDAQIHSPAPPSAEPPPGLGNRGQADNPLAGERSERPGQYSVSRKDAAPATQMREKTGRIPTMNPVAPPKRGSGPNPVVPQKPAPPNRVPNIPQQQRPPTPASGTRVPSPASRVHATAPIANRTPSPATPAPNSGVVMTRPAVIVGAPPKTSAPQQRVRKAREDEGRGFGQGLISEKSLDEVILAYLSEDAEDK